MCQSWSCSHVIGDTESYRLSHVSDFSVIKPNPQAQDHFNLHTQASSAANWSCDFEQVTHPLVLFFLYL